MKTVSIAIPIVMVHTRSQGAFVIPLRPGVDVGSNRDGSKRIVNELPTHREEGGFESAVLRVLAAIDPGTVLTYGEVALEAGYPGAARAVGSFLSRGHPELPWWRVVTGTGRLVPGHERRHGRLLQAEGVTLVNGHVAMARRNPS